MRRWRMSSYLSCCRSGRTVWAWQQRLELVSAFSWGSSSTLAHSTLVSINIRIRIAVCLLYCALRSPLHATVVSLLNGPQSLDARERSSCTSNYWDPAFPHLKLHKKRSGAKTTCLEAQICWRTVPSPVIFHFKHCEWLLQCSQNLS